MARIARVALVAMLVLVIPVAALAQDTTKKKKKKKNSSPPPAEAPVTLTAAELVPLLDKGAYDEAITMAADAGDGAGPDAVFVQGLAFEGKKARADAVAAYERLQAKPETDAWHWIGESADVLAGGEVDAAIGAAARAVEIDGGNKFAHFQHGRALVGGKDYAASAAAFVDTLEIDGNFAYAHYWAGMSYYQTKNLVAAGNHLTRFLQLAPEAPERLQVQGILATLRGQ